MGQSVVRDRDAQYWHPVELVLEPKNKHDPNAIALYSARGYQIGYVSTERCGLIGSRLRDGAVVLSIFQERTSEGGYIRVNLVGETPSLPPSAVQVSIRLRTSMRILTMTSLQMTFRTRTDPPPDHA